jgi:hypothetical protein
VSPISWQQLAFWSQVGVSTGGSCRLPASLSLLFSSPLHNGTGESEGPETFQIAPDPWGYKSRLAVARANRTKGAGVLTVPCGPKSQIVACPHPAGPELQGGSGKA